MLFFSKKAQKSFLFTIEKYYGLTCRLSIAKKDLRSYAGLLFTILARVFAMHLNNIDCLQADYWAILFNTSQ